MAWVPVPPVLDVLQAQTQPCLRAAAGMQPPSAATCTGQKACAALEISSTRWQESASRRMWTMQEDEAWAGEEHKACAGVANTQLQVHMS